MLNASKRPNLKGLEFGIRKGLLVKKVLTKTVGDLKLPQIAGLG